MVRRLFTSSSSWGLPSLWKSLSNTLGDVWQSSSASKAYEQEEIKSNPAGESLRVVFRNASPVPLILCWISEHGIPHHFYNLPPTTIPVESVVTVNDRIEHTHLGHAFALAYLDDQEKAVSRKQLDPKTVIGGYRPTRLTLSPSTRNSNNNEAIHVVTITQKQRTATEWLCCRPWGVRHKKDDTEDNGDEWHLSVQEGILDPTALNTADKKYEHAILGGWPVRLESQWNKDCPELKERLERDLKAAAQCLPEHARKFLQTNTPVYVNRTQMYGPAACPVKARGMCFHPKSDWLVSNGMSPTKAECIEMYQASEYCEDSSLWGPGGVLLHELCHAYHWKMVQDGYDNEEIKQCYDRAMEEGLYDCVPVHGPQGPTAKAYACDNDKEYFAELSTAFLGGLGTEEHNKWYPFNREQLKDHDPRAYKLLQRIWKINCDSPRQ